MRRTTHHPPILPIQRSIHEQIVRPGRMQCVPRDTPVLLQEPSDLHVHFRRSPDHLHAPRTRQSILVVEPLTAPAPILGQHRRLLKHQYPQADRHLLFYMLLHSQQQVEPCLSDGTSQINNVLLIGKSSPESRHKSSQSRVRSSPETETTEPTVPPEKASF